MDNAGAPPCTVTIMRSTRASLAVLLVVVVISVLGASVTASAQTPSPRSAQAPSPGPIALEPVVQSGYGVVIVDARGLGAGRVWSSQPTTAARGDPTILAFQSAPATREQLWPSLLPQFGLTERPEPFGTPVTDAGLAWTLYRISIGARHIMADLALAERGGRTNLVLLRVLVG